MTIESLIVIAIVIYSLLIAMLIYESLDRAKQDEQNDEIIETMAKSVVKLSERVISIDARLKDK